jgi:gliding motility-associated-like protein
MKKLLLFSTFLFNFFFLNAQSNFIKQDTVIGKSTNCAGGVSVCIDSFQYNDIGDYEFTLDGQPFNTTFESCKDEIEHNYSYLVTTAGGETGPFELISWTINGRTFSSLNYPNLTALYDSMRVWDPLSKWQLDLLSQTIYGVPPQGNTYSCQRIKGLGRGGTNDVCHSVGVLSTGLRFKVNPGFRRLIVRQLSTGMRDTVTLGAACLEQEIVRQSMNVGTNRSYCVSLSQLLGSPFDNITLSNFCAKTTTRVTFDSLRNSCIYYTARSAGTDTACIQVCDKYGICDTTFLYITASPASTVNVFSDTITVGLSRTKCALNEPTGANSIVNYCPSNSGNNVNFNVVTNTRCVTYSGVTLGVDTACIAVCNTTSNVCDTTIFYITTLAANPPPRFSNTIFRDTVFVDSTRTKCNITLPTGTINTFENYCGGSSGRNVLFTLNNTTNCVSYRGLTVGADTACVRVCNTAGVCDTTTFIVETRALPTPTNRRFTFTDTITVGLSRIKSNINIPAGAVTIENLCPQSSGTMVRFTLGSASPFPVTYTGLTPGVDSACIRVCNVSGVCDTTYMYITALAAPNPIRPRPSNDTINIKVFERLKFCPTQAELSGSPVNIIRYCSTTTFDKISSTLDNNTQCVNILGLKPGTESFCVAVCNTAGVCDTSNIFVRVAADTLKPRIAFDSLTLRIGEILTYCPDTTELGSGFVSSLGACTNRVTPFTTTTLDNTTKCAIYGGQRAGRDTTCLVVCNSVGRCDTTIVYLRVLPDTFKILPNLVQINILVGQDSLFTKIDTSKIGGIVDTIYDACPGKNGSRARMVLSRLNRNVRITGLTPGNDTMCIVVCNNTRRICDTTTIVVTVRDSAIVGGIKAVNDFDSIAQGRTKIVEVYKNDDLKNRFPTRLVITKPPTKGTADTISFRQGLIKYTTTKSPKSCGLDSFRYSVCIDNVCSEATVTMLITCADSIRVFNAISPNGDGRNDALVIEGLQNYPNHLVLIFNRWGNEVFKSKDYQNDWQGTWNSKDLPDGTYFYMVRNEATGDILKTGYLQILR